MPNICLIFQTCVVHDSFRIRVAAHRVRHIAPSVASVVSIHGSARKPCLLHRRETSWVERCSVSHQRREGYVASRSLRDPGHPLKGWRLQAYFSTGNPGERSGEICGFFRHCSLRSDGGLTTSAHIAASGHAYGCASTESSTASERWARWLPGA
jgi:hypothetical protein